MNFGKNLMLIRKNKNLSQEELAFAVGVTRQTMYTWEGNLNYPNVLMLKKLANVLEVSIEDLVSGYDVDKLPLKLEEYTLTFVKKNENPIQYTELPNWFIKLQEGEEVNFGLYDNGVKDYSCHLTVNSNIRLHGEEGYEVMVDSYNPKGEKEQSYSLMGQCKDNKIRYIGRVDLENGVKILTTFKDSDFNRLWGIGLDNGGQSTIYQDSEEFILQYGDKKFNVYKISYFDGNDDELYIEVFLDSNYESLLWRRYDKDRKAKEMKIVNNQSYGFFYECITDRLR